MHRSGRGKQEEGRMMSKGRGKRTRNKLEWPQGRIRPILSAILAMRRVRPPGINYTQKPHPRLQSAAHPPTLHLASSFTPPQSGDEKGKWCSDEEGKWCRSKKGETRVKDVLSPSTIANLSAAIPKSPNTLTEVTFGNGGTVKNWPGAKA